jgi:hypothetical protein
MIPQRSWLKKSTPFFSEGPAILFAGAGTSAKANLPVWSGYLNLLADNAEKYEPATAQLMRARISSVPSHEPLVMQMRPGKG